MIFWGETIIKLNKILLAVLVVLLIVAGIGYFLVNYEDVSLLGNGTQKSEYHLVAEDVNMTYEDGTNYTVQLTDGDYNPVDREGENITILFRNNTYERQTDENGVANLPILLIPGNYTFTAQYEGEEITSNIFVNENY